MCELLARHPPPPNTRTNTQLQPPSSGQPSLDKLSTDHPQSDIQPALDAASPQEQQQQQESSLNQQPSFRAALDGAWHALADMAAAGAIGEERLAVLCHIANAVHLAPWDGADSITSEGTTDGAPEVTGAGAEGRWYASIVAAIPYCMAHAAMLLKVAFGDSHPATETNAFLPFSTRVVPSLASHLVQVCCSLQPPAILPLTP